MSGYIARVTPSWARPVGKPSRSVMARTDGPTSAPRQTHRLGHAVELVLLAHRRGRWLNATTAGRKIAFSVP
jgi:hypothetical protein